MTAWLQKLSQLIPPRDAIAAWLFDIRQPVFHQCTADNPMPINADRLLWCHPHTNRLQERYAIDPWAPGAPSRPLSLVVQCQHCGEVLVNIPTRTW